MAHRPFKLHLSKKFPFKIVIFLLLVLIGLSFLYKYLVESTFFQPTIEKLETQGTEEGKNKEYEEMKKKIDEGRKRIDDERKRIDDERKRIDEERKRIDEENKRIDEEKIRKDEEMRKDAEMRKKQDVK